MQEKKWTFASVIKKILKITGWCAASVLLLLIAAILLIRLPAVQQRIVQRAVAALRKKIGTPVSVRSIVVEFPKQIVVSDLYVPDEAGDTLLFLTRAEISTDLWGLLHQRIMLNEVALDGMKTIISRKAGKTDFNFAYIPRKFAAGATAVKDTSASKPWKFTIGRIAVRSSSLRYGDVPGGSSVAISVGRLEVPLQRFDIDSMIFIGGDILLDRTTASMTQRASTLAPAPVNKTSGNRVHFDLRSATLTQVKFYYENDASGQLMNVALGTVRIDANHIDPDKSEIDLSKIAIANTMVALQQTRAVKAPPDTSATAFGWKVRVEDLQMSGNTVQIYDFGKPVTAGQIDFTHLWLQQITAHARNISIRQNDYQADLDQFSVREKSGFALRRFQGHFDIRNNGAEIRNFVAATNNSKIDMNVSAKYPGLSSVATHWQKISMSLETSSSSISARDVRYLMPSLLPARIGADMTLRLTGAITGDAHTLRLTRFRADALAGTHLAVSGTINGIQNLQTAVADIIVDSAATTLGDLRRILPDSLLPAAISIPAWLSMKGKLSGTIKRPGGAVTINSSDGQATAAGYVDLDTAGTISYHGSVALKNFKAGELLRMPDLGLVTLAAHVNGSGTSLQTLNTEGIFLISELRYKNYPYRDFRLAGSVRKFLFDGKASIRDKNLDFVVDGKVDYSGKDHVYNIRAELKNADFKALHLAERPLRARGTLDVKLRSPDFKTVNGSAALRRVAIFNGEKLYRVDSLLFASIETKKQTTIKISSDIVDGSFTGTIRLLSLPDVLTRHFNSYFALQKSMPADTADDQNFKFRLELKKTELLTDILLPSLKSFETSPLAGSFDSRLKLLDIHADIKKIHYNALFIDEFQLDVNSTQKSLTVGLDIDKLRYDSFRIPGLDLRSVVVRDSIKSHLIILDSLEKEKYNIGSVVTSLKDEFQFKLIPGEVRLNYQKWEVPVANFIRFGRKEMHAHDFSITHEEQKIAIMTAGARDSVLTLAFQRLDLENISNIVSGKHALVAGRMDGSLNLFVQKNNAFKASLRVDTLRIMQRDWGAVTLSAGRLSADKFEMQLDARGAHTDLTIRGNYLARKPSSLLSLEADIGRIDMSLIEPLSAGQLKKAGGYLHGRLAITGTLGAPAIKGQIQFTDVTFISAYVNSAFTLKNETLRFEGSGLSLTNFRILDDNNNAAVLKGSVITKDFRNFVLDLDMTTRNFRVLNTTAANNGLYYGKVKVNATAKVTGPLDLPVVDLKMGFSDDTEFNYVVPASSKGVIDQKGIVEFVNKHPSKDTFLTSLKIRDTVQNVIKGLSLTATVDLNDAQKLNIIIDPRSGDKLFLQGSTTLLIKIDPTGNMDLSGQYEISKGSYSFSFYKLVHRDFEILKGGTITWAGDPMEAKFNIQALYKLQTSPFELLANQSADLNPYRQAFPFLVYLTIRGDISAPEISFRIDMPEADKGALGGNIYTAIQDINTREPDLNKQVFSLLVLRRFMADDPFENQVTTSLSSNAKSSVSGLLTDQLNRLSQNIKGVQLSVDLKSFDNYAAGTPSNQTRLQLGVSKSLLHDKLVVKLAGNVDIAGENTNQNSLTDYIGDLALEYKLTSDGRLRLTGFRNSDYDMIDGELIKTGAGLIYVKDYNAFKELFRSNEKTK